MEKEKHILNFKNKKQFYSAFLDQYKNCTRKTLEDVKAALLGGVKVSEIAVHSNDKPEGENQKIEIATLRRNYKIFGDTHSLSGLLFNPILEKVGFLEAEMELNLSSDNTRFHFEPTKDKVIDHFMKYLKKLKLADEENNFFAEFPAYFNNPSFGIVEKEPGDIHRMIYADKIPIGIYHPSESYFGLAYNKHDQAYELKTHKFHKIDYETTEVKYIEVEDLNQSMFGCFGKLCKFSGDKSGEVSSSIFGSTKTKAISVYSADQPKEDSLQVILGVGLKTHLKHQDRTHKQYQGLAYNYLTRRVGNIKVFTERHYTGMGKMNMQSRLEYHLNNPEKQKMFIFQIDTLMNKEDSEFFQEHIIPYFTNLRLGDNVALGKVKMFYPVYSDEIEIGSYLVGTKKLTHNYRGLMVMDTKSKTPQYVNTIHEFKGKPQVK